MDKKDDCITTGTPLYGWTSLAETYAQLKIDLMALVGRLWLEDQNTMSPEVQEVMMRRATEFKAWSGFKEKSNG